MNNVMTPTVWLIISIAGAAVAVFGFATGYDVFHDSKESKEDNLIRSQSGGSKKYKKKYCNKTKRFR